MSNLDTLINDLVIANRILAKEDVVDAYGHVSVRHPTIPDTSSSRVRWRPRWSGRKTSSSLVSTASR